MSRIIQQALTLVAHGTISEGRLLTNDGAEIGRAAEDYPAAQEAFKQALSIAEEANDVGLEVNILTHSAEVDWFHLQLEESSTKGLEAVKLSVQTGNAYAEAVAHRNAIRALAFRGDGAAALTLTSGYMALAERRGSRYWLVSALLNKSFLACLRGDWSKGREFAENAMELTPQDQTTLAHMVMLEYETGNFSQGEAYLERLLEVLARVL